MQAQKMEKMAYPDGDAVEMYVLLLGYTVLNDLPELSMLWILYWIVVLLSKVNVSQLNEDVRDLEWAKRRVQHSIERATWYGKPIEADAEQWMEDAETAADEARRTLALYGAATETCFGRWLPNPFKIGHLSSDARRKVKVTRALLRQCRRFDRVFYESDPPSIVGGATDLNSLAGHGGDTITDSSGSKAPGDEDEVGNTLSANILEPVHNLSPKGSSGLSPPSWKKVQKLGSGSSGYVYKGCADDGSFFAVKEVCLLDLGKRGMERVLQLGQEISLLSLFKHENIVQYLGADQDKEHFYIFLELMTGSLATLYKKNDWRDSNVPAYTRKILNGLKYLHDHKVVHRDIKCANVLVDASGSVKLADFGLAKATEISEAKSSKGTAFWMAPEVANPQNRSYGLAADIWSLGATVLEMKTREHPYPRLEGHQALFQLWKGVPPPVPDYIIGDARDFILKCLEVNSDDRPSAAQLLDHPFVRNPPTSASPPFNNVGP